MIPTSTRFCARIASKRENGILSMMMRHLELDSWMV
jgi:hypothetical protein